MEILSSGSFINLDNEEKIEQLVFTAQEIAETAIKNEAFTASEENNKKLALDIWQGAEYMCRDAEGMQIKNIFISNFLERMNELSGVSKPIDGRAETSETNPAEADSKDEYLGVVQADEIQEQAGAESEIEKEKNEFSEKFDLSTSETAPENLVENEETVQTRDTSTIETKTQKIDEPEQENLSESKTDSDEKNHPEIPEKTETKPADSITLPEKEPYRFDECTVTATIQLFPTRNDSRKTVLSVRTHDFAPQISVCEITGETTPKQLISALQESFEKYKNDLPVKVMDKLRREKESGKKKKKKRSKKVATGETSQAISADDTKAKEVETNSKETATVVPQPEKNMQGSLFGS